MKNPNIKNIKREVLSDNWYTLNKYTFDYQKEDGSLEKQEREAYNCGDAAAILIYNSENDTLVLTKQFRMPVYQNEGNIGMMIEVCAGLLDGDTPEDCARKEALEETGYKLDKIEKVFEAYMIPGSVMQKVHFFTAKCTNDMRVASGGGAENETENIEVLEYPMAKAISMIASGEIKDAKTILLLQYAQIHGLVSS